MRTLITLIFFILTAWGCSNEQASKDYKSTIQENTSKVFGQVVDFPIIEDTAQFITDLRNAFDLEADEGRVPGENEQITTYKKVKIYGSDKDYIFIEYDYGSGSMATYPWKYQLLLTTSGSLIKSLSGLRFEFVTIFPNQNPFLLTLIATAKGNGGHKIYKISADTLQNVYEGYFGHNVQTYDAHQDISVFEPNELNIEYKDVNKDGFNDIVFTGYKLMLGKYTKDSLWYDHENGVTFSVENPADKIPVRYIFLYDKKTQHFIKQKDPAKENN